MWMNEGTEVNRGWSSVSQMNSGWRTNCFMTVNQCRACRSAGSKDMNLHTDKAVREASTESSFLCDSPLHKPASVGPETQTPAPCLVHLQRPRRTFSIFSLKRSVDYQNSCFRSFNSTSLSSWHIQSQTLNKLKTIKAKNRAVTRRSVYRFDSSFLIFQS